jgi:predicted acylesterase/phospholipase RssA
MFNFRPFFWALFWAPSIVDNSPAFNLIVENSGDQIRRNVSVGTTDVSTGELINYNETIGPEYLPTACFASGAYPGAFPPVPFMDSYYIDGCATANMNAFIVINRCKEMGYQDEDIVVDLFYDEPPEVLAKDKVNTTKQAIGKIDNIREYFKDEWFISQIKYDFPDVTFRYVVSPSQPLDNSPIVKPGGYQYKIDLGYNDTVKLIKMTQAERDLQLKRRYSINPHFS